MTRVFIAEKPSLAGAIAGHLWGKDASRYKTAHYYEHGNDIVTWSFGHILAQAMPKEYGEEFASFSEYPVLPETWKKNPVSSAKEQLNAIKALLKKADVVVNAGDPDREGQLLVDEILVYLKYKGKVERILINSYDDAGLKRAFDSIVPNSKFKDLYDAGLARERADWLVGMNLSREYSVNAKKFGLAGWFRIGRVKVPTLALVVQREEEIENFVPKDYFVLSGEFVRDSIPFKATYEPNEHIPVDSEGRVVDRNVLDVIVAKIKNKEAIVTKCEMKKGTSTPPLPWSLDTLQVEANKRLGMSAAVVLEQVQSLYEKKLVSYPRSDCNYIPEAQHSDGKQILSMLTGMAIRGAEGADAKLRSKAFNDKKITAHHAIIPTGVKPSAGLTDKEKAIYTMIAERYVLQFWPNCEFDTLKYTITVAGEKFNGSGKAVRKPGYTAIWKDETAENDESSAVLPPLKENEAVGVNGYHIDSRVTTPPKRFTEGTLLSAMTNIWRFLPPDDPNRERLKECKGLGTPATRSTIISELMEATNTSEACMEVKSKGKARASKAKKTTKKKEEEDTPKKSGGELVPTTFGRDLIHNVDKSLTEPKFTAVMEYNLSQIAEGKKTLDDYMDEMVELVMENIRYAEEHRFMLKQQDNAPTCPICRISILQRKYSTVTKKNFWVCADKTCVSPFTHKTIFYEDRNGKPLIEKCPDCGTVLKYGKKDGKEWFLCEKCSKFFSVDKNKKPVVQKLSSGSYASSGSSSGSATKGTYAAGSYGASPAKGTYSSAGASATAKGTYKPAASSASPVQGTYKAGGTTTKSSTTKSTKTKSSTTKTKTKKSSK